MSRPYEIGDRIRLVGMRAVLAREADGIGTVVDILGDLVVAQLDDDPPDKYWTFPQIQ